MLTKTDLQLNTVDMLERLNNSDIFEFILWGAYDNLNSKEEARYYRFNDLPMLLAHCFGSRGSHKLVKFSDFPHSEKCREQGLGRLLPTSELMNERGYVSFYYERNIFERALVGNLKIGYSFQDVNSEDERNLVREVVTDSVKFYYDTLGEPVTRYEHDVPEVHVPYYWAAIILKNPKRYIDSNNDRQHTKLDEVMNNLFAKLDEVQPREKRQPNLRVIE